MVLGPRQRPHRLAARPGGRGRDRRRTRRAGSWPPTTSTSWPGTTCRTRAGRGRTPRTPCGVPTRTGSSTRWPTARNFAASLVGEVPGTADLVRELHAAGVPMWGLTNWSHELYPHAPERFAVPRPARRRRGLRHRGGRQAGPRGSSRSRWPAPGSRPSDWSSSTTRRRTSLLRSRSGSTGSSSPGPTTCGWPCASAGCQSDARAHRGGRARHGRVDARLPARRPRPRRHRPRAGGRPAAGRRRDLAAAHGPAGAGPAGPARRCARSRATCRGVDIRTAAGRQLLDFGYDDVPGEVPALGVHRGTLFSLLHAAVRRRSVPARARRAGHRRPAGRRRAGRRDRHGRPRRPTTWSSAATAAGRGSGAA